MMDLRKRITRKEMVEQLNDVMCIVVKYELDDKLEQKILDIADALESGCMSIHQALFYECEDDRVRKIVRQSYRMSGFLYIEQI